MIGFISFNIIIIIVEIHLCSPPSLLTPQSPVLSKRRGTSESKFSLATVTLCLLMWERSVSLLSSA